MGQTVIEMTGLKKSITGIYDLYGIDFSFELCEVFFFFFFFFLILL